MKDAGSMSQVNSESALPAGGGTLMRLAALVPAWAYVVIAILSVQTGAAVAEQLFETVGPEGVVFLRTLLAALMFYALWRPKLRGYDRRAYAYAVLYGINIAAMMLTFYAAIARIPLGIAVAIAFAGPLGLAVAGSRRVIDFLWIVLATAGILLLSPFTDTTLDPFGMLMALLSALGWMTYILLSRRVSTVLDTGAALTMGMVVAAAVALPLGSGGAAKVLMNPGLAALALVVALLSSTIPFAFEFHALKQLPPRVFGLLVSLEPVVATIIGFLVLHEKLGLRELAGIAMVTAAAIATARSAQPAPME
jgi:inner membrane transporter RhtA